MKKFIEKFAELFDETELSEFKPETKFRALDEWSSIMALSVISMIDEEYDVTLNMDEFRSAQTIEELFKLIPVQ